MSMLDRVREIVARELEVPQSAVVESASFMGDLKADSLTVMELIMVFEDEFDVEIPEADMEKLQTVGDAIRYLDEKTGG